MNRYKCKVCEVEFTSYNITPKYCSLKCKSHDQSSKLDINEAIEMYESGMTQVEVAIKMGVTQKAIYGLFKRCGYKSRVAKKRNQSGENNDSWKGNNAGYSAFHRRMDALFGKPKKCEVCGIEDKRRIYQWASLTGAYHDTNDYKRMCQSCHAKYDNIIKNIQKGGDNHA